jgi:diacylglycerol kinase family enzyme
MSSVLVLLNARSGLPYQRQSGKRIEELFAKNGVAARVILIENFKATTNVAREAVQNGCEIVVAAGGDGTVSGVAAALVNTSASLGVIPLGTLNHFARDLRLPLSVEAAIETIAHAKTAQVDVGAVNQKTFVNNASIGIYPNIVMIREREQRMGSRKWVAFAKATVAVLRRFPFWTVRLRVKGRSIVEKTPFVFAGNNEYQAEGLEIGRRERLDAGHLCLYIAAHTTRWGFIRMALSALFGHLDKARRLQMLCVDEAWIETRHKHILVATDGEVSRMRSPLHYRVLPKALKVIVR